jgi:hypothetical protein
MFDGIAAKVLDSFCKNSLVNSVKAFAPAELGSDSTTG